MKLLSNYPINYTITKMNSVLGFLNHCRWKVWWHLRHPVVQACVILERRILSVVFIPFQHLLKTDSNIITTIHFWILEFTKCYLRKLFQFLIGMSQSFKWKTNPFKISWNLKISVPRLCYCSIYDIDCMISAASKESNKPTSTAGTSGSHRFLECQLSALVWEQTMYTVGSIIIHASMSSHFWSP